MASVFVFNLRLTGRWVLLTYKQIIHTLHWGIVK